MSTSFPVLTFHAIDDRPSVIAFAPKLFRCAMAKLCDAGYRTLGLLDLAHMIRHRRPLPDRSFTITFDDGYQSVYEQAFPILQHFGFSATVFLTVGKKGERIALERLPSMEGRSMLSWGEIKEMHRCGIAIGAHTLTHPDLTRLDFTQARIEILRSKEIIENVLGEAVNYFAYPYGRYDNRNRQLVRQHFVCACSDQLGLVHASTDLHAVERVDAYYLRTEKLLSLISSVLFPLYIKARSVPRTIRRAIRRG